jgi:hypothetical protein
VQYPAAGSGREGVVRAEGVVQVLHQQQQRLGLTLYRTAQLHACAPYRACRACCTCCACCAYFESQAAAHPFPH